MSLTTRCPACGTIFKVVPDQLRISEGWVRCGHCSEIFDANLRLRDEGPGEDEQAGHAPSRGDHSATVPADLAPESEGFASSLNTEIGDDEAGYEPLDPARVIAEAQALIEHPLDRPFELRRKDAGEVSVPRLDVVARRVQPEPDDELQDLTFVREARREAFWQQKKVRSALLLCLILLGLFLLLQITVHDRDRLAAADASLRPLLSRLCEPLGCEVRPPRQIDAIVIDSSSFNRLRGDAYRLNVNLKNQAAMDVAMPALELTLTDGQDQPLVRRVLMPSELGAHEGVITAASDWSGSLALALTDNANAGRVAGYRLLAFYP
jgi:predicted Zn finger-like uncharacterized protein